jgi:hypothetical protein
MFIIIIIIIIISIVIIISIMYTRYHLMFDIGGAIKRGEWRVLANKYDSFITCQP